MILLTTLSFAQNIRHALPWISGNDTVFTTTADTLDIQFYASGLAGSVWEPLTQVLCSNDTVNVTADDKAAQSTKIYLLTDESFWTRSDRLRFRIRAEDDTLTSAYIDIRNADGSAVLFVEPTIYGDATPDTIIYKARFITR